MRIGSSLSNRESHHGERWSAAETLASAHAALVEKVLPDYLPPEILDVVRRATAYDHPVYTVRLLASSAGTSRRTLLNRLHAARCMGPRDLVEWGRLLRAVWKIERLGMSIERAALEEHFGKPQRFRDELQRRTATRARDLKRNGFGWVLRCFHRALRGVALAPGRGAATPRPGGTRSMRRTAAVLFLVMSSAVRALWGQQTVSLEVRVIDATTNRVLSGARVVIEGTQRTSLTGANGVARFESVSAGPTVVRVASIGYAPARHPVQLPASGSINLTIQLARNALSLSGINVVADPVSRARGEAATASVIEREAIRNQTAASLAGILELVPGVTLQPPGLDGVQQFALRSLPVAPASAQGPNVAGPSAENLASFGTQIVVDGVPLSNNVNLQTLGARGELSIPTSAGGGIDLRRLPAATIERVEVIRGVPSARYGDLTQGVVIVDTRAGAVDPEVLVRYDPRTLEASTLGGRAFAGTHAATSTFDVARTRIAPGVTSDLGTRYSAQIAHRFENSRWLSDARLDAFQLVEDRPFSPVTPQVASQSRDAGLRLSERLRSSLGGNRRLEVTAALEGIRQRSFSEQPRLRGPQPFTNRLIEGRQTGKYVGGSYVARVDVAGDPRQFYWRSELSAPATLFGADQQLRTGIELRREWNGGPGYQFDIEFPPQVEFNGVQGFARPRRFDLVPPLVTSALYMDDRWIGSLGGRSFIVQAGIRGDVLHDGDWWTARPRDVVVQPRLTSEWTLTPRMRLRGSVGRLAKTPALGSLFPAPQYHDLVNVNFFANEPAERLAVITTRILDPTNRDLRLSIADRAEVAAELDFGGGGQLTVVAFNDRLTRGVGIDAAPAVLVRERYAIDSTTVNTGRLPRFIEPAFARDSVPVLLDRPANTLTVRATGLEVTALVPEIPRLRTRVAILGSWTRSALSNRSVELTSSFTEFQLSPNIARVPYWNGSERIGERILLTTRAIHHQPGAGLVITAIVQAILRETRETRGAVDSLSWAGYITRSGSLVPVAHAERNAPQFADIRRPRTGVLSGQQRAPADWLLGLQVSKALPGDGRLSFYAFNAFDRAGNFGDRDTQPRLFPALRFGLEVTMPLGLEWGAR